jgi:hypothetical protein
VAVFVGEQSGKLFEDPSHIGGVVEPRSGGDFVNGQVGINQERFGQFKMGVDDFVVDGASECFLKFHLKRPFADTDFLCDIINLQGGLAVFADIGQCGDDVGVVDGEDIGRAAAFDIRGLNLNPLAAECIAAEMSESISWAAS